MSLMVPSFRNWSAGAPTNAFCSIFSGQTLGQAGGTYLDRSEQPVNRGRGSDDGLIGLGLGVAELLKPCDPQGSWSMLVDGPLP